MCYYNNTKEKNPVTRVLDHFFTNTSYKGCTLFVRRIRLLSFGTASGHIKYKGYDPPALQVRNMIYIRFLWGFLFFRERYAAHLALFQSLKYTKYDCAPKNHNLLASLSRKAVVAAHLAFFQSLKYTKNDCALKKHNLLASLLRKNCRPRVYWNFSELEVHFFVKKNAHSKKFSLKTAELTDIL